MQNKKITIGVIAFLILVIFALLKQHNSMSEKMGKDSQKIRESNTKIFDMLQAPDQN